MLQLLNLKKRFVFIKSTKPHLHYSAFEACLRNLPPFFHATGLPVGLTKSNRNTLSIQQSYALALLL